MPYKDNERRQQYYLEHKEELDKKAQIYYQEHREERIISTLRCSTKAKVTVLSYYSKGTPVCIGCGITDIDVLCIDHINGGGDKHRRSIGNLGGSSFYYWIIRNNYPEGYQVLCANCNLKKRILKGEGKRCVAQN